MELVARVGRDRRLCFLQRIQSGTCAARWLAKYLGDMEKHGGAFMEITYWRPLRSSLELGDRKWRLNRNGEIMETNYGDQNFIHHVVENTYLERFKDRNV